MVACCRVRGTECSSTCMGSFEGGCHYFTTYTIVSYCQVASVVSDSVQPHRWQPTRLHCPWDSPGKNTGVGCHFQVNSREGTQPHSSTENWIKDLLSMALPIRKRPSFPCSQPLSSGSFHKLLILIHQRVDRMKTTITEL